MRDRDVAILATSPLFAGIDAAELGAALRGLPASERAFENGSVMLLAGCAYESLYVLIEGEAAAEMSGLDGRSLVVETLAAPAPVATAVLFSPERRLPVTVVARSRLRVAVLPRPTLLALAARFPEALEALLSDMGARLSFLADKYRAASFATLGERLADWLLRRAEPDPAPGAASPAAPPAGRPAPVVVLKITKERLAESFGVARPSLSREFARLEARGLIASEGRVVRLLDERGLRLLAAGRGAPRASPR